ncbi:hypothetical protein T552_01576 [Pneumocystis carinii B80]|uniref:Uncharacterized protein n=1 Tax=Pneumocystis carinii (strain B80) TaxID=1408658 RepID=A0A0W4ZKN8_PNEC8|nr:hypothetical protein T552_01576 [Pneumocystis carinii B80]KTW28946.1 hypothetical protein T552_01576 [Pneumocystis carinii B80]
MTNPSTQQKESNYSCDHNINQICFERSNSNTMSNKEFTLSDILERWTGSEETLRSIMVAKAEEDRLKQEIVRLNIKKIENEIFTNALRNGVQPNAIPIIFSGQQSNSTLALSQNNSLISIPSQQYQLQNSGLSEASVPGYCPGTQGYDSTLNQSTLHHLQTNISNVSLDSFSTTQLSQQKNSKSPFMIPKNTEESTSNQNSTSNSNSNSSSLPSLFFHHWIPPRESTNSIPTINNEGSELSSSSQSNILSLHKKETSSFSPSKKKRLSQQQQQQQQQHLPPSFGNSVLPPLSKRSPRRHSRHRSETSILQSNFFDIQANKRAISPISNEIYLTNSKNTN